MVPLARRQEVHRRQILTSATVTLASLVGLAYGGLAVRALLPPDAPARALWTEVQAVGSIRDFPAWTPTLVWYQSAPVPAYDPRPRVPPRVGVFIVNTGTGELLAFKYNCTYHGCPVHYQRVPHTGTAGFSCPCCGAIYNLDGTVRIGPPPRPLDRFDVLIQDGFVSIRLPPESPATAPTVPWIN